MAPPQLKPSDTWGSRSALAHPPLQLSTGCTNHLLQQDPAPKRTLLFLRLFFTQVAQTVKNPPAVQETRTRSLG